MRTICLGLLLICTKEQCFGKICDRIEDTEIRMVFLVNRHGDRTPEKQLVYCSNTPKKLAKVAQKYGYMQLNPAGKSRCFALGKQFRRRYIDFLSSSYNTSNIQIYATDTNRTIETARIAITAAYSPEENWRDDIELIPVKFTIPVDLVRNETSLAVCPTYQAYINQQIAATPKNMDIYQTLLVELSKTMPLNITYRPNYLYALYDLDYSQLSLGLPLSKTHTKLLPLMKQGATVALDNALDNDDILPLEAGIILRKFFEAADQIVSGANAPRFIMYSAHDLHVYSFVVISRARPKQGIPEYCSMIALELRKCRSNGLFYVVPVYISSPGDTAKYLSIQGCGHLCEYHKYKKTLYKFTLDLKQFQQKCNLENDGQSN